MSQLISKICLLLFILFLLTARAYKSGEPIKFAVNKVSPINNPSESYKYYQLPFCTPEPFQELPIGFGEGLSGNRRINSFYQVLFGFNEENTEICQVELSETQVEQFREAIKQNYIFELFIGDIIVGTVIGHKVGPRYYLATHLNFIIFYNKEKGNIIKATVEVNQNEGMKDVTTNSIENPVSFSYSVTWNETPLTSPVTNKLEQVGNDNFFTNENHGLSFLSGIILNTSLFLVVTIIFQKMQITDNNYQFSDIENERRGNDFNWKSIRNEVYRTPGFRSFLCAVIGTGVQLAATIIVLLVLGGLGYFSQKKGSTIVTALAVYIVTAVLSGICSGLLFKKLGGKQWHLNIIFTALCFPLPAFCVSGIVNNIAWAENLTSALPLTTILMLLCVWTFGALPLTGLGGVTGRLGSVDPLNETSDKPSKLNKNVKDVSNTFSTLLSVLLTGLFTFSVFHFELYYIFTALWGHKIYVAYGTLLVIFVLSLNVAVATSIIFTYFQLNNRDFRWWWKSVLYGGSCSIYIFAYAVYFYIKRSQLSGFAQTTFYFGYSILLTFITFLVFGAVGFLGTSAFIKQSYERRKMD